MLIFITKDIPALSRQFLHLNIALIVLRLTVQGGVTHTDVPEPTLILFLWFGRRYGKNRYSTYMHSTNKIYPLKERP